MTDDPIQIARDAAEAKGAEIAGRSFDAALAALRAAGYALVPRGVTWDSRRQFDDEGPPYYVLRVVYEQGDAGKAKAKEAVKAMMEAVEAADARARIAESALDELHSLDAVAKQYDTAFEELRTALTWCRSRLESVLAGRPVRDVDECIEHAKKLETDYGG
jgi:hypothetical protein